MFSLSSSHYFAFGAWTGSGLEACTRRPKSGHVGDGRFAVSRGRFVCGRGWDAGMGCPAWAPVVGCVASGLRAGSAWAVRPASASWGMDCRAHVELGRCSTAEGGSGPGFSLTSQNISQFEFSRFGMFTNSRNTMFMFDARQVGIGATRNSSHVRHVRSF